MPARSCVGSSDNVSDRCTAAWPRPDVELPAAVPSCGIDAVRKTLNESMHMQRPKGFRAYPDTHSRAPNKA